MVEEGLQVCFGWDRRLTSTIGLTLMPWFQRQKGVLQEYFSFIEEGLEDGAAWEKKEELVGGG